MNNNKSEKDFVSSNTGTVSLDGSNYPKSSYICFTTKDLERAAEFYKTHFFAREIFAAEDYILLVLGSSNVEIAFMRPKDSCKEYVAGAMLTLKYDDVDSIYNKLKKAGLKFTLEFADHDWGHRGFSVLDNIGVDVYCYKEIS